MRPPLTPGTAVAAAVASILAAAPAAPAAVPAAKTLYVAPNGTDTDNTCDVRPTPCRHLYYAIGRAGTYTADAVTIVAGAGTYAENDEIDVPAVASLTIEADPGTVTVEGLRRTHASVFTVSGGTVVLRGLTLTHGDADSGGGIDNTGATVTATATATATATDSTVTGNAAAAGPGAGGGIYQTAGAATTLTRTVVTGNYPDDCDPVELCR